MSGNPSKLSQFWQELKRHLVNKVIVIYAELGVKPFILGPLNKSSSDIMYLIELSTSKRFRLLIMVVFPQINYQYWIAGTKA